MFLSIFWYPASNELHCCWVSGIQSCWNQSCSESLANGRFSCLMNVNMLSGSNCLWIQILNFASSLIISLYGFAWSKLHCEIKILNPFFVKQTAFPSRYPRPTYFSDIFIVYLQLPMSRIEEGLSKQWIHHQKLWLRGLLSHVRT